ncbi:UNVERIFIED_CONTAM: Retrovirus-related Pol polyprotein from transposon RE2, partial [Sesamum latifolium]
STRVSQPLERYNLLVIDQLDNDPKTYEEAMPDIDLGKWLEVMRSKMDSLSSNKVWILVDPLKSFNPIGFKSVYKRNLGADGEVTTFKARLVAKGYTQRPGIDFEKTYSPVTIFKSIRILLAIFAYYDYEIWWMDVKTSFVNGFIEKEIYMDEPIGFISKGEEEKIFHFHRSIYGLKQKKVSGSSVAFLVLYVDDILLVGNDTKMLGDTKA